MLTFRVRSSLILGAALIVLSSCSPETPMHAAPAPTQEFAAPILPQSTSGYSVKRGLLFIADSDIYKAYNDVQVYDVLKKNELVAKITDKVDYPQSVCIDNNKTLYVVNGDGWISEYALGDTTA